MSGLGVTPLFQGEEISSRGPSHLSRTKERRAMRRSQTNETRVEGWQSSDPTQGPWSHLNPAGPGAAPTPPSGKRSARRPRQCCCRSRPRPVAMETRRARQGRSGGGREERPAPRPAHSAPARSSARVRRDGRRYRLSAGSWSRSRNFCGPGSSHSRRPDGEDVARHAGR